VGSLPAYLGVIMTVAVALPGAALYIGHTPWRQPTWLDRGAQLPVVVVIWVAAVLACLTGVRLTAVLLLGAVGYGMSMLYVLHGAPDLALTQLLVETLSIVVFLFVLRLLPTRFPRPVKRSWTGAKVFISAAVGVLATAMTLYGTSSTRTSTIGPAVSAPMLEQSYPEGHGRNVVNVILVDFRGLDTFGEATVVLVAALGIALLVLTARHPHTEAPPAPARAPSLLLRVAVRVAFYPILATGLFFLFAGHNNPGGGFIGGLVASLAFVLRYLSADVSRASEPLPPIAILGTGLLLSAGCALAPMLGGGQVLTSGYLKPTLPLLGDISLTSVLIFDSGIFLVVVGLTLVLLDTLGSRQSTSLGVVDDEVLL
jgi:multicomponent Na+:H+ antiporter subunit A